MNTVVHSHVKTGTDATKTPTRKPLVAELENYSEKQRVVIRTCRHLVKHKYRELLEWCQRVKTDKVEVMATLTDVRLFSEKNNTLPLRESLADNQPVTLIGRPRLAEFNDQITLNFYVDEVGDGSSVSMIGREEYRCVELLR